MDTIYREIRMVLHEIKTSRDIRQIKRPIYNTLPMTDDRAAPIYPKLLEANRLCDPRDEYNKE